MSVYATVCILNSFGLLTYHWTLEMYRCLSKFSNSVSLQVSITVRVIPKAWSEPSNEAEAKHVAELLLRICQVYTIHTPPETNIIPCF